MLTKLRHVLTGEGSRISRLHTQRGTMMRPLGIVSAVRARSRERNADPRPWMAPTAVDRLDEILDPHWTILELGSGASTAWYASRVERVISIEDDPDWAATARRQLHGKSNAEIWERSPRDVLASPGSLGQVDVAIVDHLDRPAFTRVDSMRALSQIPSLRLVVLDDSDRPEYRDADAVMTGWKVERFVGMRARPLVATETTLFTRP